MVALCRVGETFWTGAWENPQAECLLPSGGCTPTQYHLPLTPKRREWYHTFREFTDVKRATRSSTRCLMTTVQLLNTTGAARRLGCSATWIYQLVSTGKLKAYLYDPTGVLVERKPEEKCPGQGLYFLPQDVDAYHPAVRGRPRGSKTKQPRSRSARGKNGLNVVRL